MAISFGHATSNEHGTIVSIQSSAKRAKGASLILACASFDDAGTIIHEHGKKFHDLWLSPAGHVHAVSADGFHHTNATGAWVKTRVAKDTLFSIWGLADDHVLIAGNKGALFEICRGETKAIPNALSDDWFSSISGSGPDDIYAVGRNGLLHFDGKTWTEKTRFLGEHLGADGVVAVSRDEVYITNHEGLYLGNLREGWTRIVDRKLQYITRYRGEIYAASYSGGIVRLAGGEAVSLREDISVTDLDGDGRYLCATGMAEAIHVFDGTEWRDKTFG